MYDLAKRGSSLDTGVSALMYLFLHEKALFCAKLNFSELVGQLIKVCQVITQKTCLRMICFL
jgi:hypothetical protein